MGHEIRYRLGLRQSVYIGGLDMARQLGSIKLERRHTKYVQEPRIEGAPSCGVVGVILQEKLHLALGGGRQHERFEILFHLSRSAATSFSECH